MKQVYTVLLFIFFYAYSFEQPIPKIKMNDVVKMIDTTTTPLIINFWASWCHPCINEIPLLEKYAAKYRDSGLKLILISVDFSDFYPVKLQNFIQSHNYQSQVYWLNEPDPVSVFYKIDKHWAGQIPATIMVNNKKHYKEFYNQQLAEYQVDSYYEDLAK